MTDESAAGQTFHMEEIENAASFASVEMEAASLAWKPTLNRSVAFESPQVERVRPTDLAAVTTGNRIIAEILLDGEDGGKTFLMMPEKYALIMVSSILMLSKEETEEKLGAPFGSEDFDAIAELANHFAGSAAPIVQRQLNRKFDYILGHVRLIDPSGNPEEFVELIGENEVIAAHFNVSIAGYESAEVARIYAGPLADSFRQPTPEREAMLTRVIEVSEEKIESDVLFDEVREGIETRTEMREPGTGTHIADSLSAPNVARLLQLEMEVSVSIAEKRMTLGEILALSPGTVIEFPKRVDQPLVLTVNEKPIARGAAVVQHDKFAFRVTDILGRRERIKELA